MEKAKFTIGVDVSRNTLDVYCLEIKQHLHIPNNASGFTLFCSFCKTHGIDLQQSFVVLEYTGGYEYRWLQFLQAKNIAYVRIPGLAIKRSLGIVRGKNDRVDAARIAQYGDEKYKTIFPEKPLNPCILRLKELLSFRKKLVRENAGYKAAIQERKHMFAAGKGDFIIKTLGKKLLANQKEIKATEERLVQVVEADELLRKTYMLLTSIKGIGPVNALMTIAFTENFTSFTNARSYAVYVGVVPFDHRSGTSLKGRKSVSPLAQKELKQELNQAAKSALQFDGQLKTYATRKLQNKPYGLVLNNVKFKLILRMFAVVKRGEKYVANYQAAA